MNCEVELDIKELKRLFSYDEESGLFTRNIVNHNRFKVGEVAGCKNNRGYISIEINGKAYLAHRLAWFYVHGEMPKGVIDHINGVKTDNRIQNLRDTTQSLNMVNRKLHRNNKSGYSGVSLVYENKSGGKTWTSAVKKDKVTYYLGTFSCEVEAYKAYVSKMFELYSDNAPERIKQDYLKFFNKETSCQI